MNEDDLRRCATCVHLTIASDNSSYCSHQIDETPRPFVHQRRVDPRGFCLWSPHQWEWDGFDAPLDEPAPCWTGVAS